MNIRRSSSVMLITVLSIAVSCSSVLAQGKGGGIGGGGGKGDDSGPSYELVGLLGFPENGYQSQGRFMTNRDVDGNLLIVGDSRLYPDPEGPAVFHPALWRVDANGNFPLTDPVDLGIPEFSGGSEVFGLNAHGVVVADTRSAVIKDADGNWIFPAYVDVPDHPFQELPSAYTRNTGVGGINDAGQIIGHFEDIDPQDPTKLITVGGLWHLQLDGSISGPASLGEFYPDDINNFGVMAGKYKGWPAIARLNGQVLEIVELDVSLRFFGADVTAINDYPFGDVMLTIAGVSHRDETGNPDAPARGFGWRPFDAADPVTVLGTLGGVSSWPLDVNRSGHIVGWSDTKRHGQQAFIYRDGVLSNLNSLVDVGSNTLQFARAINDDGDITGFMRIPKPVSEQRGFLLRPIATTE